MYSNTGGQASKSTPRAAVAKFAMGGKGIAQERPRSDRHVLRLCLCGACCHGRQRPANPARLDRSRSLRWTIAHHRLQSTVSRTATTWQRVSNSKNWRCNPVTGRCIATIRASLKKDKNPLVIESKEPSIPISQYAYNETRYKMLTQMDEDRAEELMKEAQHDAKSRWTLYQQMASMHYGNGK